MNTELSVIVPLFNEAESFNQLLSELLTVLDSLKKEYEIIFIDDCSTDSTAEAIRQASRSSPSISAICLSKNTKKSGALRAGILKASSPIIITMDGDLQDDPSQIPTMLQEIENGSDVIIGWKKNRKDGPGKKIPSRIINYLCSQFFHTTLHDMNSGLKVMTKEAALSAPFYNSSYRYMAHFLAAEGYTVREVPVVHRKRIHGKSKFGIFHRLQSVQDFFFVFLIIRCKKNRLAIWLLSISMLTLGLIVAFISLQKFFTISKQAIFIDSLAAIFGFCLFLFGLRIIIAEVIYRKHFNFVKKNSSNYSA